MDKSMDFTQELSSYLALHNNQMILFVNFHIVQDKKSFFIIVNEYTGCPRSPREKFT